MDSVSCFPGVIYFPCPSTISLPVNGRLALAKFDVMALSGVLWSIVYIEDQINYYKNED
jgi:hypothetical protein